LAHIDIPFQLLLFALQYVYTRFVTNGTKKKNRSKLKKHGIRFEVAIQIFDDPECMIEGSYDDPETEEPRWIAIGFAPGYAAELVVIHVYRYEE